MNSILFKNNFSFCDKRRDILTWYLNAIELSLGIVKNILIQFATHNNDANVFNDFDSFCYIFKQKQVLELGLLLQRELVQQALLLLLVWVLVLVDVEYKEAPKDQLQHHIPSLSQLILPFVFL